MTLVAILPCLDPDCWSIVHVLPFVPSGRERQFIVAAEGATPRNRSGRAGRLTLEDRLRKGNLESAGRYVRPPKGHAEKSP